MNLGVPVVESKRKVFYMIKDLLTGEISVTNKHLQQRLYNAVSTQRSTADFTGNQTQRYYLSSVKRNLPDEFVRQP